MINKLIISISIFYKIWLRFKFRLQVRLMFYIGIYFPLLCHFEHLGIQSESGSKWTVQKVKVDGPQSGQSRESGRSVQKWTALSQTGRFRTIVDGLFSQSGPSEVKVDDQWSKRAVIWLKKDGLNKLMVKSGRSKIIKVDGREIGKCPFWTFLAVHFQSFGPSSLMPKDYNFVLLDRPVFSFKRDRPTNIKSFKRSS